MATMKDRSARQQSVAHAIREVANFNVGNLARTEELGSEFTFAGGVLAAERICGLFKQVNSNALPFMGSQLLETLMTSASNNLALFNQVLQFNKSHPQAFERRVGLLNELDSSFDRSYEDIWPAIAISLAKNTDLSEFRRAAESVINELAKRADQFSTTATEKFQQFDSVLIAKRDTLGLQGVETQASHFDSTAQSHDRTARLWMFAAIAFGLALLCFSWWSLSLHKNPTYAPTTAVETIQLGVSKALVFSTLAFALLMSARNYSANRHNSVVNMHRQNALMTYRAIVEAGHEQSNRDIILTKAAECIFSPQPTGFGKSETSDLPAVSLVSVAPGAIKATGSGTN